MSADRPLLNSQGLYESGNRLPRFRADLAQA